MKKILLVGAVSVLALLATISAYDPTSVYATHNVGHTGGGGGTGGGGTGGGGTGGGGTGGGGTNDDTNDARNVIRDVSGESGDATGGSTGECRNRCTGGDATTGDVTVDPDITVG